MTVKTTALTFGLATLLLLPLLASACGGDDGSTDGFGGGGGQEPDAALANALTSIPVFPQAKTPSLTDGRYRIGNYNDGIVFGSFEVSPETTAEDVIAFFGKVLPSDRWQQEKPAWTATVEGPLLDLRTGERLVTTSTYYSFLKDDMRLLVEIPIGRTRKNATPSTGEVSYVNLIVARKDMELFPSPLGTPVHATPPPPPTEAQETPSNTAPPAPSYEPTPITTTLPPE